MHRDGLFPHPATLENAPRAFPRIVTTGRRHLALKSFEDRRNDRTNAQKTISGDLEGRLELLQRHVVVAICLHHTSAMRNDTIACNGEISACEWERVLPGHTRNPCGITFCCAAFVPVSSAPPAAAAETLQSATGKGRCAR